MLNKFNDYELSAICEQYLPHNTHAVFYQGFVAYRLGQHRNPYDLNSVTAQAFDRGQQAAMRYSRMLACRARPAVGPIVARANHERARRHA